MKILFCTNKFEEISNGPAKFANLLLQVNEKYPAHCVKILTEDVTLPHPSVYKLDLRYPRFLSVFSQLFRIFAYHNAAKRIQKEYDFDVIVYNNAFIGLLSALNFPVSVGMINDYSNASRTWRDAEFKQLFIKQFLFKQLERFAAKAFSKVILNSDYLKNYIQQTYKLPSDKCFRLYKGVEISDKSIDKRPLDPKQSIRVLFVKTDYVLGGLEDLVLALSLLPNQFTLSVIGPSEQYFNPIQAMTSSFPNIELRMLGYQIPSMVNEEMINADIFCVPSHKEALGVANIEALATQTAVISSQVGGIPEVLDQGRCAWLVPPNDSKALSQAIEACINNNNLRQEKISHGLKHAAKFDIGHTLENFLKILEA